MSIVLKNESQINTSSTGIGKAGAVKLETANLELDQALISSSSLAENGGDGGAVLIKADDTIKISNQSTITTSTEGQGHAGSIDLSTRKLDLASTSQIISTSNASGNAGAVKINAEQTSLNNAKISTSSTGEGQGGNISIDTLELSLDHNAAVQSTGKDGDAGTIIIKTPGTINLNTQSYLSTASSGQGHAGDIQVSCNTIEVKNSAYISSGSTSTGTAGNAGTITVKADDDILINSGGSISTEAANAGGGEINLQTPTRLHADHGSITTSVKLGAGNGGDISISNPEFIILKASDIIANAYEGQGGNIHITTDHFIKSSASIVSASSELGIDGNITIESPDTDIGSSLIILPQNFIDASAWVMTPCSQRSDKEISRFIVTDRDGVSTSPDDWLPSP